MFSYASSTSGICLPCPQCGAALDTGASACGCGFVVGYGDVPAATPAYVFRDRGYSDQSPGFTVACPQCGKPVTTAQWKCAACGYAIGYGDPAWKLQLPGDAANATPAPAAPKSRARTALGTAGAIYVFIVIVLAGLYEVFDSLGLVRTERVAMWVMAPGLIVFAVYLLLKWTLLFLAAPLRFLGAVFKGVTQGLWKGALSAGKEEAEAIVRERL